MARGRSVLAGSIVPGSIVLGSIVVGSIAGCVPGFDHFTRVEPDAGAPVGDASTRDGGPPRDAGPPVDGGPENDAGGGPDGGCSGSVLRCAPTCDGAFERVFDEATFDVDQGDFSFRPVSGGASIEGGHLLFSAEETWLLSRDQWGFGTVMACAEVEVSFGTVDDTAGFLFGLRGPEHGMLSRLRPAIDALQLVTFEPAVVTLDEAGIDVPEGGATARFVLLSYVDGDYAHAEARRVDTGDVVSTHGSYGGGMGALELELSFFATTGSARVDWVRVGRPTTQAQAWLDAAR